MSYTQAQLAEIGKQLATASGGLVPAPVGAAWASAEQGIHNNVFGLGASTAGVPSYPSIQAAVYATWHQLSSSSTYAQTIGRLKTAGGNVSKAALAIAESPWHLGAAGVKAAGGVDPYYGRVFTQAGLLTAADIAATKSGGGSSAPPASGGSTIGAIAGGASGVDPQIRQLLLLQVRGQSGTIPASTDLAAQLANFGANGNAANAAKIQAAIGPYFDGSHTWSQLAAAIPSMNFDVAGAGTVFDPGQPLGIVGDAIGGVSSAISGLPGAIVGVAIPVIVLVGLLWVGKVGLEKTLG